MADPVQKPDISSKPAAKAQPSAPKTPPPANPKEAAPSVKELKPKPKEAPQKQLGKPRLEPLNINLGRTGLPQESAFPIKKDAKAATSPAPAGAPKAVAAPAKPAVPAKPTLGAKPAAGAKPEAVAKPAAGGAKPVPGAKPVAPAAKGAPVAKSAPAVAPAAKAVPPAATPPAGAPVKKAPAREKDHYFIIENLCVGCGLCLDKCPPKVKAIGYKFYGDVQEGGFRAYIDQDACISCASCFNSGECPAGALIEVHPDGEVLDYVYTPPERLDFDLRFLHRFHREAR